MTYRHKKAACSKKTREILERYAGHNDKKYASVQFAGMVNLEDAEKLEEGDKTEAENVQDEEIQIEDDIQLPPMPVNETEIFEDYVPIQEVSFEVEATKEEVEKKKKKRNYIEFRADYS